MGDFVKVLSETGLISTPPKLPVTFKETQPPAGSKSKLHTPGTPHHNLEKMGKTDKVEREFTAQHQQ